MSDGLPSEICVSSHVSLKDKRSLTCVSCGENFTAEQAIEKTQENLRAWQVFAKALREMAAISALLEQQQEVSSTPANGHVNGTHCRRHQVRGGS